MRFAKSKLLNLIAFKQAVKRDDALVPLFKKTIKHAQNQLKQHHLEGISSADLVEKYTWVIDQLIILAWQHEHHQSPDSVGIETHCSRRLWAK